METRSQRPLLLHQGGARTDCRPRIHGFLFHFISAPTPAGEAEKPARRLAQNGYLGIDGGTELHVGHKDDGRAGRSVSSVGVREMWVGTTQDQVPGVEGAPPYQGRPAVKPGSHSRFLPAPTPSPCCSLCLLLNSLDTALPPSPPSTTGHLISCPDGQILSKTCPLPVLHKLY
jgi:hypothetical protein